MRNIEIEKVPDSFGDGWCLNIKNRIYFTLYSQWRHMKIHKGYGSIILAHSYIETNNYASLLELQISLLGITFCIDIPHVPETPKGKELREAYEETKEAFVDLIKENNEDAIIKKCIFENAINKTTRKFDFSFYTDYSSFIFWQRMNWRDFTFGDLTIDFYGKEITVNIAFLGLHLEIQIYKKKE